MRPRWFAPSCASRATWAGRIAFARPHRGGDRGARETPKGTNHEQEDFFESNVRPLLAARCFPLPRRKCKRVASVSTRPRPSWEKARMKRLVKPGHPDESLSDGGRRLLRTIPKM